MSPAVSVLLPVYNGERYVAAAIDSILAQTFTDFECLIIDDGSTDRSRRILERYATRDSRIRLIVRPNQGLIATLNEMLHLATGEFLARMDADDIAMPDRLARQVEFLRQHPQVICVGGAYELIDPRGRFVMVLEMPEHNDEIQQNILSGRTIINHPCALICRSALLEIGGYDPAMVTVEDLDMLLRLGEIGQLANLKDVVLKYRFHMQSVSAQNAALQQKKALEACQRAWARRGIVGGFNAPIPLYRPGSDRPSQRQFMPWYGWWAFNNGFRGTAASSALRAIALQPAIVESWKLLACALIKPTPNPSVL